MQIEKRVESVYSTLHAAGDVKTRISTRFEQEFTVPILMDHPVA